VQAEDLSKVENMKKFKERKQKNFAESKKFLKRQVQQKLFRVGLIVRTCVRACVRAGVCACVRACVRACMRSCVRECERKRYNGLLISFVSY